MLRNTVLVFCVLCAAILFGCGKTETTNSNTATENSNKPATAAATPGTSTTSTTSSGDKIGIAECDDFLTKYEACVSSKVPEMARAQYQSMLKTWRAEWKKAADNPQTRDTLVSACKQMATQQESALKMYGCSF
jgi:hypothetical protein